MYTIDLTTLLQLLREFRRTGVLRAELPSGVRDLKRPCLAVIELLNGEVVTCQVKDTKGQTLFWNQEAYEAIVGVGKLNWVLDSLSEAELPSRQGLSNRPFRETTPPTTGPVQMPLAWPGPPGPNVTARLSGQASISRLSRVPRHRIRPTQRDINAWPRLHRQIYILIDGARSVERIAAMLSQPAQIVEQVLQEIEATGAILLDQ